MDTRFYFLLYFLTEVLPAKSSLSIEMYSLLVDIADLFLGIIILIGGVNMDMIVVVVVIGCSNMVGTNRQ